MMGRKFLPRGAAALALAAAAVALLAGCGSDSEGDLREWMAELRATTRPRALKVTEPTQFLPQDYEGADGVDPFNPQKLTQALRRDSEQSSANASLIAPELARRKEPLEAYPLDAMKMVGSLDKEGQPTALINVDKLLYQVKVGNHLGQNYGRIVAITETEVRLREIVQDPGGDWVERTTTLELQEGSGEKK